MLIPTLARHNAIIEDSMSISLKTDEHGRPILYSMTGWELRPVADIELVMVIEYAETLEQLQSGERKTLQVIVYPEQAVKLADELKLTVTGAARSQVRHNTVMFTRCLLLNYLAKYFFSKSDKVV